MRKTLMLGIILLLIVALLNVSGGFSTPAAPKVYVEPKRNVFSTQTTNVGDNFTISVSTSGWEAPGLFAYECKLRFDTTLLELTKVEYPADHFIAKGLPAGTPMFTGPVDAATIAEANTNGYIGLAASPLADPASVGGRVGGGVLAKLTFKIKTAPPPAQSCDLKIIEPSFLDPDGEQVTVEIEDGYYEFSAPKPPVYLKVEPASVSAAKVDDEVTISVTINEMQSTLQLANVTFKLNYNTTLLSTSKELITQGATYPYFDATVENGYVKVEVQIAKQAPFPSGRATLAIIKFKAIYVPENLTTSPLTLSDVVLTDINGNIIEYDHLDNGEYKVPVTVDIYDLTGDGKVDIEDIYELAKAFGSRPGHPRWNPRADVNGNGKVNVVDAVLIAMHFKG